MSNENNGLPKDLKELVEQDILIQIYKGRCNNEQNLSEELLIELDDLFFVEMPLQEKAQKISDTIKKFDQIDSETQKKEITYL